MQRESNKNIVLFLLLSLITCSQTCICQSVNSTENVKEPYVISTKIEYYETITQDSSQTMVNLARYIIPLFTDWKYATINNFTGKILYKKPMAYVRRPIAEALEAVQKELSGQGLSLLFYDAYRPYSVTKKMWKAVPDDRYAANPAKGSGHNRGAAVDVGLANKITGKPLLMPTSFDNFSDTAHHTYMQLPEEVIQNRQLLLNVMEKHGFVALETEWWHYSWPGAAQRFALLDFSFRKLKKYSRE